METGSEGEVTNNDFPLRKTGKQQSNLPSTFFIIIFLLYIHSLGTKPSESPPQATCNGTSLQSAQ